MKPLLYPILFLFVSYSATVLGLLMITVFLSLLGSRREARCYLRIARRFVNNPLLHPLLMLLGGLLPIPAIFFLIIKDYHPLLALSPFSIVALLCLLFAYLLILPFRSWLNQPNPVPSPPLLMGIFSLGSFLLGSLVFISAVTLLVDPEKWFFIHKPYELTYSWNLYARFLLFLILSLLLGSAKALSLSRQVTADPSPDDDLYFHKLSCTLGIIAAFALPIALAWETFTLPMIARSALLGIALSVVVLLLAPLTLLLLTNLADQKTSLAPPLIALCVLIVISLITSEGMAMRASLRPGHLPKTSAHLKKKPKPAVPAATEEETPAEENAEAPVEEKENPGEKVFQEVCSGCHDFEARIVGPPLKTVLPKYKGKPKDLTHFLLNPTKVNPDYPEMPNLGLSNKQAQAVAEYLLQQIAEENP